MGPRKMIYHIIVFTEDPTKNPRFSIATHDKSRLPMLIDKNRMFIEQAGYTMVRWQLIDEFTHTLNMPQERYETEVLFCDIVDGDI